MKANIAIFCTGGTNLGFGHFFRSKVFAKAALKKFNVRIFAVAEDQDRQVFKDVRDISKVCQTESVALKEIIEFAPNILVFDTVYCSDDFIAEIKRHCEHLVSISPVFNQMHNIDILFTRNEDTPDIENVKIFKGFKYTIFNDNCIQIPDAVYNSILCRPFLTIGIAMGGGDAPNKTLKILKAISQIPNPCTFWVLLGEGYKHSYQDLVNCLSKDSNHEIILAKTNRSIWNILSNCSLAILAGGLTTMESIYAGLPSINIFEKEEHLRATSSMIFDNGMAFNLGLFKDFSDSILIEQVEAISGNKDLMLSMRDRMKGVLDKYGADRICKEIETLVNLETN
jgi:Spore coat polysaccharide biosynthesis protein, predicted glycosyltransferase